MNQEPALYRINIKPSGIDSFEFCLKNDVVGCGWTVGDEKFDNVWKYKEKARQVYPNNKGCISAINIMSEIKPNDLIWTRNPKTNVYYLCKVKSFWQYVGKGDNLYADIINFVDCEFIKVGTVEDVPAKVVNSFRARRTAQRVKENVAIEMSKLIYNRLANKKYYDIKELDGLSKLSSLSPEDVEEIVLLYLQIKQNYAIYSNTLKSDTAVYECVMVNKDTGEKCYPQVKTGWSTADEQKLSELVKDGGVVYLFFMSENYSNHHKNIKYISKAELLKFVKEYRRLIPDRITMWFE